MDNFGARIKSLFKMNIRTDNGELPTHDGQFVTHVLHALENDEFEVYYQPQYNYNTKKLCGAEALMRWRKRELEYHSPAVFIPRLEKAEMIYEVDRMIWEKVCRDLKKWKSEGLALPHLSVNVSRNDICHDDLEENIVSLVDKYGIEPHELHLEITETAYMSDLERMVGVISSLQARGFIVEMDDFGSGYSSLRTLKNVPFDVIKLDMELVAQSESDERAKSILTSVVDMLKKLKLRVIVEGVEYEEQAQLLNRLGCSYMQGYYFGRPTCSKSFEELLKTK